MRFGAFVPQGWRLDLVGIEPSEHWPTMLSVAGTIESAGYDSLWVFDHFHTIPVPTQEVTYEAWTLMAALAPTTSTVRLGQMCTCNGYRHPSYLAKVAASIDVISAGRIEMGIGAGWYEQEFDGYGYPFPKGSVRVGQLDESVEIMRRLWTEDVVSFHGEHYRLDGAICRPNPVQQPHIPLWVAGGGEQLTLRVAAKHAQYTNFGGESPEQFVHKSAVLQKHCADVGRDFDEIVRSVNFTLLVGEDEADVADRVGWMRNHYEQFVSGKRLERVLSMWGTAGTPEQIAALLQPYVDAGMEYAIVNFPDAAYDTRGLELFASAVAPALA